MEEEMHSIKKNDTWKLVELSRRKKVVGSKWVYKIKFNVDGIIKRHKDGLVSKGFTRRYGIDYEETCAPIGR